MANNKGSPFAEVKLEQQTSIRILHTHWRINWASKPISYTNMLEARASMKEAAISLNWSDWGGCRAQSAQCTMWGGPNWIPDNVMPALLVLPSNILATTQVCKHVWSATLRERKREDIWKFIVCSQSCGLSCLSWLFSLSAGLILIFQNAVPLDRMWTS